MIALAVVLATIAAASTLVEVARDRPRSVPRSRHVDLEQLPPAERLGRR